MGNLPFFGKNPSSLRSGIVSKKNKRSQRIGDSPASKCVACIPDCAGHTLHLSSVRHKSISLRSAFGLLATNFIIAPRVGMAAAVTRRLCTRVTYFAHAALAPAPVNSEAVMKAGALVLSLKGPSRDADSPRCSSWLPRRRQAS